MECINLSSMPTDRPARLQLSGDDWSEESVDSFREITANCHLLLAEMSSVGVVSQVDLCKRPSPDMVGDSPTSVRDVLVFRNLARFASHPDTKIPNTTHRTFHTMEPLAIRTDYKVVLCFVSCGHVR